MSTKEKLTVAYHEIGHALVAAKQTDSAPVQKITIIPRTSGALGYTMQVDEQEHFLMSKEELENKIAYARQFYNDVVLKLNTAIETVPTNIIAGLFHFEQAQYFEADDASRQVPQVQF